MNLHDIMTDTEIVGTNHEMIQRFKDEPEEIMRWSAIHHHACLTVWLVISNAKSVSELLVNTHGEFKDEPASEIQDSLVRLTLTYLEIFRP